LEVFLHFWWDAEAGVRLVMQIIAGRCHDDVALTYKKT
jgi:hypothetical protein